MSIETTDEHNVAFVDQSTGIAFGPVFQSTELAQDYRSWVDRNQPIPFNRLHPQEHAMLQGAWFRERCDPDSGELRESVEAV